MIHLFHGDDTFQSRRNLLDALRDYKEVDFVSPRKISSETLVSATGGLFLENKKALVLENLFSLHLSTLKKIIDQIKKLENEIDFFIWEEKKLTPGKISLLGEKKRVSFSNIPATIFKLLDNLGNENPGIPLGFFKTTLKTHPPELIFFLIKRRLRELLIAKAAPEELKGAPWQKGNILSQAKNMGLEKIKGFYLQSIEIELKNKTGQLGNSLKNELTNLILLISGENETN